MQVACTPSHTQHLGQLKGITRKPNYESGHMLHFYETYSLMATNRMMRQETSCLAVQINKFSCILVMATGTGLTTNKQQHL